MISSALSSPVRMTMMTAILRDILTAILGDFIRFWQTYLSTLYHFLTDIWCKLANTCKIDHINVEILHHLGIPSSPSNIQNLPSLGSQEHSFYCFLLPLSFRKISLHVHFHFFNFASFDFFFLSLNFKEKPCYILLRCKFGGKSLYGLQ